MKTHSEDWSRRDFLRLSTAAGAGATLADSSATAQVTSSRDEHGQGDRGPDDFNEATIAQLQAAMAFAADLSSVELTIFYLRRIRALDESGPRLNSVLELNRRRAVDGARGRFEAARTGRRARAAARHSDPAQGQHRHRRPDADDGRLVRARGQPAATRFHRRGQAARRRRRDPRQAESQRVGELPIVRFVEWLERARRTVQQPVCDRPQPVRLELRARGPPSPQTSARSRSAPRPTAASSAPRAVRRRRHQADGWR